MSEKTPIYYDNATPQTREAFRARPSALPFSHPDYRAPTPEEFAGLITYAGWSQNDVAKLAGVNYNPKKGSTTIRKWRAPITSDEHRDIPYSAWRHLLACAGIVTIDEDLASIGL